VKHIIHNNPRSNVLQRNSDEKPLCVLSIPYVKRGSEKFKKS